MKDQIRNLGRLTLLTTTALTLTGCWTTPNAQVQPVGQPGLIQRGIMVESVKNPMTVAAIDPGHTITFKKPDGAMAWYPLAPNLKKAEKVKAGDLVQPTMKESLDVYLLVNGRVPFAKGSSSGEVINTNAKVLLVDPSYRLLTLQYPDGSSETFKVGLEVKLRQMAPGDSVKVRTVEVTALSIEKS